VSTFSTVSRARGARQTPPPVDVRAAEREVSVGRSAAQLPAWHRPRSIRGDCRVPGADTALGPFGPRRPRRAPGPDDEDAPIGRRNEAASTRACKSWPSSRRSIVEPRKINCQGRAYGASHVMAQAPPLTADLPRLDQRLSGEWEGLASRHAYVIDVTAQDLPG
jgi:hypothetical protein